MVFSSLFFLYAFLPLCMIAYALCRSMKAQNIVLLVFSLFFYAWGEPKYVLLLAAMSAADWLIARKVERIRPEYKRIRRRWVTLATVINLGLIGFFKYAGFLCSIFGEPPTWVSRIALPIGISFYTFQLLSYVVDVSRGDAHAEKEYWHVLLYGSLYHQCIAGPIVRYKSIAEELFVKRDPWRDLPSGVLRFSVGLGKKVLLANVCGDVAGSLLMTEEAMAASTGPEIAATLSSVPVAGVWLGMAAYMLQIYLDFSAYSDMAIGLGRMLGLHYVENFDYPYCSGSVTEFWRRWHISLGTFFRDYVYIPLGGSREGLLKTLRNSLIVWALTGLWHGASWNFVLWGLWFFLLQTLERFGFGKLWKKVRPLGIVVTLACVYFGWILFRFNDMECVKTVLRGLVGANGNPMTGFTVKTLFHNRMYVLLASAVACTPLLKRIGLLFGRLEKQSKAGAAVYGFVTYGLLPAAMLLLSTAALVGSTYNPFLYFQF